MTEVIWSSLSWQEAPQLSCAPSKTSGTCSLRNWGASSTVHLTVLRKAGQDRMRTVEVAQDKTQDTQTQEVNSGKSLAAPRVSIPTWEVKNSNWIIANVSSSSKPNSSSLCSVANGNGMSAHRHSILVIQVAPLGCKQRLSLCPKGVGQLLEPHP